jgi:hypothetical protein
MDDDGKLVGIDEQTEPQASVYRHLLPDGWVEIGPGIFAPPSLRTDPSEMLSDALQPKGSTEHQQQRDDGLEETRHGRWRLR